MTPPMYTRDPVWPNLSALSASAEPMTAELWEAMKQGYRHVPVRPSVRTTPSRARIAHDGLGLYSNHGQRARLIG